MWMPGSSDTTWFTVGLAVRDLLTLNLYNNGEDSVKAKTVR